MLGLLLLGLIFYLPYFVPQKPTASASYLFGFNNRAAVVLLLVFSVGFAVWKKGYGIEFQPVGGETKVSRKVLAICLAIQMAGCLAMVSLVGALGGLFESAYEIDRIGLLGQGKLPYVDFEWPFGVSFVYGPLWLARVLHCGPAGGYYVFWIAASVGGVALLAAVINRLDYPTPRKTSIFVFFFVALLPAVVGMGVHYTWLRYMAPLYCILEVHRAGKAGRGWLAAGLAVGFTAALLLLSPEMAIAHAFASCVLLFPRRSPLSPAALPGTLYAVMLTGLAALLAAAYKMHMLDTLLSSGGGADSFPISFSAPALCFFAAVFVCMCALVVRWRTPAVNDNSVAVILLAVPLLAAALGRCDPGHMLGNGAGFFLAAFLFASPSARTWRMCRNAFAIGMMVLPSFTFFRFTLAGLSTAVARRRGAAAVRARIDFAAVYPGLDLRQVGVLDAPFGYKPNGYATYLSDAVDYGYYKGLENANTPAAVERKIDELARHPERDLLIPAPSAGLCAADARLERALITVLFFSPYLARVEHPRSVHEPLCEYIAVHYRLVRAGAPVNFEYELWAPAGRSQAGHDLD
jgi:hypothetical protein